ncbi:sugar ABC transporter ATP-binding protein [Bifidobacterium actinocoloniiforme DSM 22766]|uniref:Sugar ABC transporter ATP-binding protein n=1 Tax=Bifidobacterium actinocoloniiforme DSM 22766 TaxID=1437605 RepID=A0A086Z161_9BIFI|nr:ATP-binding cassette domain-containing protein [Bifidobacterium actinocoloniiforme]AKV56104.1 hypothetical protein AB656_03425 [Bifidobacterium actinocoloniiforme DSM 22766]KFI40261.1 sugar ABC transporter ATP-binding protein [Bifidobacterium actinocoloniiforme DSM 22766]
MTQTANTPLLELRDITMRFGFIEALKSVDFTIFPQEVVAVVGDNGAGKSTLMKVIAGLYQPTKGDIRWRGGPVTISNVHEADSMGIGTVFQGQEFCENLNVSDNLFLGRELTRRAGIRDDEAMRSRSRRILDTFASSIGIGQSIASLSTGQRQTVAIARTLLNNPSLVLLDEPTASLSVMQTAEVLTYIKRLRTEGRSVMMICHDLPDVFAVADRIVVLRQGRINGVHNTEDTSYEEIIAQIAGVDTDGEGPGAHPTKRKRTDHQGRMLIDRSMRVKAAISRTGEGG